ncbi:hypothetical protein [Brachybacterium sp. GPGPB12]|uniref:hypothetical protein n=1 Tax=Brachybacterium sp. GPGPB12 TaxID=3023517 RepID=UPI00313433D6
MTELDGLGRLTAREKVARDMLMVTQGDVDQEYAWRVQDEEVRDEPLAQADAAIARIVGDTAK